MIEGAVLFKVLSIAFLAMISPGPDFMIVSSIALTRGRIEGIKAAAGVATVIIFYTLLSLTGLSALFARYFWLAVAIKICGGLYLTYLGFLMWKSSLKKEKEETVSVKISKRRSAYLTAVLTGLTNPKSIAFFASIFALALTPETHLATKAVIAVAVPLMALLWFSFVAFGLSKEKIRLRYQRMRKTIDRLTGTVLAFFGLKLVLSARG